MIDEIKIYISTLFKKASLTHFIVIYIECLSEIYLLRNDIFKVS